MEKIEMSMQEPTDEKTGNMEASGMEDVNTSADVPIQAGMLGETLGTPGKAADDAEQPVPNKIMSLPGQEGDKMNHKQKSHHIETANETVKQNQETKTGIDSSDKSYGSTLHDSTASRIAPVTYGASLLAMPRDDDMVVMFMTDDNNFLPAAVPVSEAH